MISFTQYLFEHVLLETNIVNTWYINDEVMDDISSFLLGGEDDDRRLYGWVNKNLKRYIMNQEEFFDLWTKQELIDEFEDGEPSSYISQDSDLPQWIEKADDNTEFHIMAPFNSDGGAAQTLFTFIEEISGVIDYLRSDASPRDLSRLAVGDAMMQSAEWHENLANQIEDDKWDKEDVCNTKTIHKYKNGYEWKEVYAKGLEREGAKMGHCVGQPGMGYDRAVEAGETMIYSLRDESNNPHVTIEVKPAKNPKNVQIIQIQGRRNSIPTEKYVPYIIDFLNGGNHGKSFNVKKIPSVVGRMGIIGMGYKDEYEYLNYKNIPENYTIKGDLDLRRLGPVELPNNLTILGSLYLNDMMADSDLPKGLKIRRNLHLNRNITKLPKDIKVIRGMVFPNGSPMRDEDFPKGVKQIKRRVTSW